jgi:hypothetical protein
VPTKEIKGLIKIYENENENENRHKTTPESETSSANENKNKSKNTYKTPPANENTCQTLPPNTLRDQENVEIAANQAVFYAVTKADVFNRLTENLPEGQAVSSAFVLDRYLSETFQGIMPDSGTAGVSTAGEPQFLALRKLLPILKLDTTTAGKHKIKFRKRKAVYQGNSRGNSYRGSFRGRAGFRGGLGNNRLREKKCYICARPNYWSTKHYKEKLSIEPSTYDPCLLISTNKERFGIVAMQTDDTLGLSNKEFAVLEDKELNKANFTAKPKETLSTANPLQFNGCILSLANNGTLALTQKGQGTKIELIDIKSADRKQLYVQQRARGAYIASICQPEAAFDLSVAAQHQEPTSEEYTALNKRLNWQAENLDRGLKYVILDLNKAKIYVFVDGSFANNKDLSSQIGFVVILANENTGNDEFDLYGNLIHWSSTKSRRVTRSVLASEIYGMVAGADLAYAIGSTLTKITSQLDLPIIPIVVCTDSYSLYECLVKLGTTKEKRLMIDIMALRQSYERRELYEIRWINGLDNPADAMTKATPNKALETFVSTNQVHVRVEGWVKR